MCMSVLPREREREGGRERERETPEAMLMGHCPGGVMGH